MANFKLFGKVFDYFAAIFTDCRPEFTVLRRQINVMYNQAHCYKMYYILHFCKAGEIT